jgi:hypothetical protein
VVTARVSSHIMYYPHSYEPEIHLWSGSVPGGKYGRKRLAVSCVIRVRTIWGVVFGLE